MKVLIADDQAGVRSALKVLLEQEAGIDIAGEAEDIGGLISRLKLDQPDMVLLDWELSGESMARLMPVLRKTSNDIAIIAMSVRPEAQRAAMAAGADAFISKGENSDGLLKLINELKGRL